MRYLNKVLAKKLPKLKLHDSDLGNIGLVLINGKKVTFEEFSKMENLKVKGNLDLREAALEKLPKDLKVGGNLWLYGSKIKELPSGLTVGGHLDLYGSKIKELPSGLKVGGDLGLYRTAIKELPEDLKVKGEIRISSEMKKTFNAGRFKSKVRVR